MENLTLPIELINAIVGYLGKRPYEEVHNLIGAVQQAAQAAAFAAKAKEQQATTVE